MAKVRDFDKGYKALCAHVFGLGKPVISVGIHEEPGAAPKEVPEGETSSGLTLIQVAEFHEFGLGVPERSFIRAWFDENRQKCREDLAKLMPSVMTGKRTKEQILELLGSRWKGEIQKRISAGIAPPLEEETVKKKTVRGKKGTTPLIDTGQLRSSIDYKVTYNAR